MSAWGGREMRCAVCEMPLDAEDNYCRNCGEAVQIAPLPAVRPAAQPPAIIRAAAVPIASGAVVVAATVIARWALGQAVRGVLAGPAPGHRREATVRPAAPAARAGETVEFLWYRRTHSG
jgi:hypothetical protein